MKIYAYGAFCAATLLSILGNNALRAADGSEDCHIGLYRLEDGRILDVGPNEKNSLRWRLANGETGSLTYSSDEGWTSTYGWTGQPDGKDISFGGCTTGRVSFEGLSGEKQAFDITETSFASGETSLEGRLVMPKGQGPVPIVVLIHGSERMSAREFYFHQRMFPAEGIGTFVYDKRGTGGSAGTYTQDYQILADDAVAALAEAKRLAGVRAAKVGFQGGSQGGWVAPLAATKADVDYMVVSFGLAVSPLEEDRSAILLDMVRAGYGASEINKAMAVADATAAIVDSGFSDGYAALAAVKAKYGNEPWFAEVRGNITWFILASEEATLREVGPRLLPGIDPHYDPVPVLEALEVPQLWILGGEDREAPSQATQRILRGLSASGKPIITAVFPLADHGIYEFEITKDDERISTRGSEGYFDMMVDYILHGDITSSYGNSRVFRAD